MLEQVKDAITATPLPAPMSENDLGWIRWTFAGLSFLFLSLLGIVYGHSKATGNDVDRKIAKAVRESEEKMAGSILANATRNADIALQFNRAKDEIWQKLDEFNAARIKDARSLASRDDLAALEVRVDKRLEDLRDDAREDRRTVVAPIEQRLAEINRMIVELHGRRT